MRKSRAAQRQRRRTEWNLILRSLCIVLIIGVGLLQQTGTTTSSNLQFLNSTSAGAATSSSTNAEKETVVADDESTRNQKKEPDLETSRLNSDDEHEKRKSRRRFVSYTSSKWEQLWLDNVAHWAHKKLICKILLNDHAQYIHDFMNSTCTFRHPSSHKYYNNSAWCKIDDAVAPLWYDTANRDEFMLVFHKPVHLPSDGEDLNHTFNPLQLGLQHEHILSKFVFLDETTQEEYVEYIEPLVGHLRHPLGHCNPFRGLRLGLFRGFVVPPPVSARQRFRKAYYFDAGASSWSVGPGGPSLKYFVDIWKHYGFEFDEIRAFEMQTNESTFYPTVPSAYRERTTYRQCAVSSSPDQETEEHPFIPYEIDRRTNPDDYVLFKLDIDSPFAEVGSIEYLLENPSNVDEVLWEHHTGGNYLLRDSWGTIYDNTTLLDSYQYFLKLRQLGIRAHSWV